MAAVTSRHTRPRANAFVLCLGKALVSRGYGGILKQSLVGRVLLGRFRVSSFLREGGMSSIYAGEQIETRRPVAIKVLRAALAEQPNFVKRFAREAEAASRLEHPNIVKIFAWGDEAGLCFIVMELLVGEDLVVPIRREGGLSELRAAKTMIDVANALSHAHVRGVVHRDLKPENVMLARMVSPGASEVVKVLDFGIAKVVDDRRPGEKFVDEPTTGLTGEGNLVGTPAYMSPEQGRAEPIDFRHDIYACGVLLYELITGVQPFRGETPLQTIMLHVNKLPTPPREHVQIHRGLEATILRALNKSPRDRHGSAEELALELRLLLPMLSSERRPRPTRSDPRRDPDDKFDPEISTSDAEETHQRNVPDESDRSPTAVTVVGTVPGQQAPTMEMPLEELARIEARERAVAPVDPAIPTPSATIRPAPTFGAPPPIPVPTDEPSSPELHSAFGDTADLSLRRSTTVVMEPNRSSERLPTEKLTEGPVVPAAPNWSLPAFGPAPASVDPRIEEAMDSLKKLRRALRLAALLIALLVFACIALGYFLATSVPRL
jgi:eukaryotic-like serine/threonine-protein kinase